MSTPSHPSEPSPRRSGPPTAVIIAGTVVLVGAILAFALSQNQSAPESAMARGTTMPGANLPPLSNAPVVANAPAANGPAANAPAANQPAIPPAATKPGKIVSIQPTAPPVKPKVNPSDLPPDHPPVTADEGAQVGIQWLGHSCFYIHSPGGVAVVTDPFDPKATGLPAPSTGAHFVTVSNPSPLSSFVEAVHPFKDETTLKPLPLNVVRKEPAAKDDLRIQPVATGSGTMYVIQAGELRIAHLGGVTQPPSVAEIKALGKIDILMLPVGAGLQPKQAVEIAKAVAPSIVMPMAYSTPDMEGPEARLRPVEAFVSASPYAVTRKDSDVMMISPADLPSNTEIYLLRLRG